MWTNLDIAYSWMWRTSAIIWLPGIWFSFLRLVKVLLCASHCQCWKGQYQLFQFPVQLGHGHVIRLSQSLPRSWWHKKQRYLRMDFAVMAELLSGCSGSDASGGIWWPWPCRLRDPGIGMAVVAVSPWQTELCGTTLPVVLAAKFHFVPIHSQRLIL